MYSPCTFAQVCTHTGVWLYWLYTHSCVYNGLSPHTLTRVCSLGQHGNPRGRALPSAHRSRAPQCRGRSAEGALRPRRRRAAAPPSMQISARAARSTVGSAAATGPKPGSERPGRAGPRAVRAAEPGVGQRTGRGRAAPRRDLGEVRALLRPGAPQRQVTVLISGLRGCSMSVWREQPC